MAKIGVQASTLKAEFATLGTFETLRAMSDIGYRAIELSQVAMTAENITAMRRAQDELGVEIVAMSAMLSPPRGFVFDSLTENYDKIVAVLQSEYVETPVGKIKFDAKGDAEGVSFSVYQVKNGKYELVK